MDENRKNHGVDRREPVIVDGRVYHLRLTQDQEDGGYIVQCVELPGALEQGDTPQEAITNGTDAIKSVLQFQLHD